MKWTAKVLSAEFYRTCLLYFGLFGKILSWSDNELPVDAHPISKGIRKIVTSKSAMVRCMSKRLTRVLVFLKSLINAINTIKLAIEPITNKVPYPTMR